MPTWRCLSAMARTTPFRMGGLSLTHGADEVLAGTEEIVITPQSDPPLQAGTYFVSVVVFATGVVVNCTLTAEVERRRRRLRRRQAATRSRPGSLSPSNGDRLTPRRSSMG